VPWRTAGLEARPSSTFAVILSAAILPTPPAPVRRSRSIRMHYFIEAVYLRADFWRITISGHFKGRPVNVGDDTCWTPQMELIGLLGISDQLNAHIVPLPVRRDLFAKVAEIWPGTPAWVIPVARAEVRVLHDPQPLRMRITDNLVELWGDFHCQNWRLAKNRQPPHQIRRGTYARFTIDRETHKVTSLWIGPKHLGGEGSAPESRRQRASLGRCHQCLSTRSRHLCGDERARAERGEPRQSEGRSGRSGLVGKNRFCVESTVEGRIASENWPPLPSGKIADQPCGLER